MHHLKLNEYDGTGFNGSEHYKICAIPIRNHIGNIYKCTQWNCNFILHETCAYLPRKMWYMLHPHLLELQACGTGSEICDVCARKFCGFVYTCNEMDCRFEIDVSCASVSEPFIHTSHPHPLFCTSTSMDEKACSGCKRREIYNRKKMECIECDFALCLRCISLPSKVRYKQDRHPLVLESGGEEAKDGSWWCKICEGKLNLGEELYYTCEICRVTIHLHCILGKDPLMMPGRYLGEGFEVEANSSCFRPFSFQCGRRCPSPVCFKKNGEVFCTLRCLWNFRM
ncbi:PREDICTED: uncharacterized protein LOC104803121 [Tarenaya hassleriana]|uniref:uncharacterized protein LOC104803121 n=1 Tax=Tarenaya hassleriana TaxID=28532 RepID=UPI0008FD6B41|nr:PREDICTED: uncharacterized protein LOC104803121 [Tarenaya hassleriana]